jgi:hypothetical protein
MPKNKTGGSGHKKRKNHADKMGGVKVKPEDLARDKNPEACQVYGCATKKLGSRRFHIFCQDPDDITRLKELNCKLMSSCRKNIMDKSFVLVQLYPFNKAQGGIIDVYSNDDMATLKIAKLWDFPEKMLPAEIGKGSELPSFLEEDQSSDDDQSEFQENADESTPDRNANRNLDLDQI